MSDVNELAKTIFMLLGGLVAVMAIVGFLFSRYMAKQRLKYYRRAKILTNAELRFYKLLKKILIREYDVLTQVRLANLVEVNKGWFDWELFAPIGAKCVDFVVCDRQTMETLLVIELDDRSHEKWERMKRDMFVDQVLTIARIPILHVPLQPYFDLAILERMIREKIKLG